MNPKLYWEGLPKPAVALAAAIALSLASGCNPPAKRAGLPTDALDAAITHRIGDPATCVLLADRASGKVVYRFGSQFNCTRGLPACDRPGTMSATDALPLAAAAGGRATSCPSNADGSRMVGWAEGHAATRKGDLNYSAVMEGEHAMPGQEIAARLGEAFQKAGY